MILLLLRFSPWIVASFFALASWFQWRTPLLYPWPLVGAILVYIFAAIGLLWRSRVWKQGVVQLIPPVLTFISIAAGHLLVEGVWLRALTTLLFAFLPWLVLELSWFLLYDSARYPAHGLGRLNVAFVPIGIWYMAFTLHGLQIFLQIIPWVLGAVLWTVSVFWFVGTIGSWSKPRDRRWIGAGLLIGLHAAILLLLLPTSMAVHGSLAALLVALPLSLRGLALQPKPAIYLICFEGGLLGILWLTVLFSARWV